MTAWDQPGYDPDAELAAVREFLTFGVRTSQGYADMAYRVRNLDSHIRQGGRLPADWATAQVVALTARGAAERVRSLAEGNATKTLTAGARDAELARQALSAPGPFTPRAYETLRARADHPTWTWAQIGAATQQTKDGAIYQFRRAVQAAAARAAQ